MKLADSRDMRVLKDGLQVEGRTIIGDLGVDRIGGDHRLGRRTKTPGALKESQGLRL